jgi:hypothetical protein
MPGSGHSTANAVPLIYHIEFEQYFLLWHDFFQKPRCTICLSSGTPGALVPAAHLDFFNQNNSLRNPDSIHDNCLKSGAFTCHAFFIQQDQASNRNAAGQKSRCLAGLQRQRALAYGHTSIWPCFRMMKLAATSPYLSAGFTHTKPLAFLCF